MVLTEIGKNFTHCENPGASSTPHGDAFRTLLRPVPYEAQEELFEIPRGRCADNVRWRRFQAIDTRGCSREN